MKHKTKKIIILLTIILAGFLLNSCNIDDETKIKDLDQTNTSVSHKRFEEIVKQPKFINAIAKATKSQSSNKSNANTPAQSLIILENQNGFTINKENVNVVETDSLTFYTLQINRENSLRNELENLIIRVDINDNIQSWIIKYVCTADITNENKNEVLSSAQKSIIPIDLVTSTSSKVIIDGPPQSLYYMCITTSIWVCNYEGHTATGTCTHGHWENSTMCYEVGGGGGTGTGTGTGGDGGVESGGGTGTGTGTGPGDGTGDGEVDHHGTGTGGTSGTGTGGTGVYTAPVTDDLPPCQLLAKLAKSTDQKIRPDIDWLKSKANDITNDTEHGVTFKKTLNYENKFDFQPNVRTSSPPGQLQVELTVGGSTYGGAHLHPTDGYAMFSYGDLRWLVTAYETAYNNVKEDVVFMLVCKDKVTGQNKVYAIKVDDIAPLKAYVDAVWNDPINAASTDKKKMDIISKNNAEEMSKRVNKANLEKYFLEKYKNLGFSMYKATNEFLTDWNKLVIENNTAGVPTVTAKPCN